MRYTTLLSGLLLGCTTLSHAESPQTGNLKLLVGSPAPAIKVGSWAQGKALGSLQKGKVYVLEFWATWCGPCVKAMPHLSELSKKYKGKISFVGVNVWEDQNGTYTAPQKVAKFFKEHPNRMTYDVAIDSKDGYMAENWLKAAGVNSIPTSVVIGKDLKVAYIGHPMDLDLVLDPILEGRFDAKAFSKRPQTPDTKLVEQALVNRDAKTLKSEADRIEKGWPTFKDFAFAYRFIASYIENPKLSPAEVNRKLVAGDVQALSFALVQLASCKWVTVTELSQIADWMEQAVRKDATDGFIAFVYLPNIYERLGDTEKAADATTRLVEAAKKMGLDEATIKKISERGSGSGGGI